MRTWAACLLVSVGLAWLAWERWQAWRFERRVRSLLSGVEVAW